MQHPARAQPEGAEQEPPYCVTPHISDIPRISDTCPQPIGVWPRASHSSMSKLVTPVAGWSLTPSSISMLRACTTATPGFFFGHFGRLEGRELLK
eukprot:800015-Rhodomonas_salina.1